MGYEVDFLPVGLGSKGGDAIAIRYGDLHGAGPRPTVMVIDGGYTVAGTALVNHIRTHFGTSTVAMVVSTHPDQDHICGLKVVLEELDVRQLLMHQPQKHPEALRKAEQMTAKSAAFGEALQKSLEGASELEQIANRKKIPIIEPFAGDQTPGGTFRVLGPSKDFYERMLSGFPSIAIPRPEPAFLDQVIKRFALSISESLGHETLGDDGTTSPQNDSSVISLMTVDGERCLFTGDAGIPALSAALDAYGPDWKPSELTMIQVPHHGSHHNVGPTVLDRLLGKGRTENKVGNAIVSAPCENPEHRHPSRKVANAFRRRGYPVWATQGKALHHYHDAPARSGYHTAEPLPFFTEVE